MFEKLYFALAFLFCLAAVAGCTKKIYTNPMGAGLGNLLNQAAQDDIAKKYGPPSSKQSLSDGGEVWAYDYRSTTTTLNQEQTPSSTQCLRVIFIFDKHRILRDYRRERC